MTVADRKQQVHADGQIWSQALWEIRLGYVALGKTTRAWDTHPDRQPVRLRARTPRSAAAAKATYAKALARDGAAAAALVKDRFAARGISF